MMLKGLLGKKLGMTRLFTEEGLWIPVTLLQAGPCTVVQRKTADRDGYEAVQVGYGDKKESRCTKPLREHFKAAGVEPKKVLREFKVDNDSELKPGDMIGSDIFKKGDRVDVSGLSKGRGFAGAMKRHNFAGGPNTHGSRFHRRPGSVGASATPAEIVKGKKMPGQMGNCRVTVQNLEIIDVVHEKNLLVIRGAVPGANGGMIMVKHSVKGAR
ncbi:MAG: 50S ribosomal protein L3 [Candidatus Hydrogenedentes bacterium ADurb.Bin170]|jgi:large subunit ribosomal protein L3|nr:MAG: 50S ribosomal protein L3 [Candidatus Hydrogenedentes bacterium ADurb.Bin170]